MHKNLLAVIAGLMLVSSFNIAHAQSARSLFSASSGVTFSSNVDEGKKSTVKPSQYLGVAYTIFKEVGDGTTVKVSPKTIFKSGDRIKVQVTPNTSGYLKVLNVDPLGNSSVLSMQNVQAGGAVNIPSNGFLKFVGNKGVEELIFILSTKSLPVLEQTSAQQIITFVGSCSSQPRTRALVIDDVGGNEFNVLNSDGTCASRPKNSNTRALVVDVQENTGYGVVPSKTLTDGQVLTLKIRLRHD